jgi:hypothetical protein
MAGKLEIFNGIVELAKAGYKPSDVKDILETLKTDPEIAGSAIALDGKPSDNRSDDKAAAEAEAKAEADAIAAIIERNNKGE